MLLKGLENSAEYLESIEVLHQITTKVRSKLKMSDSEDAFVALEPGNISRQKLWGGGSEYFIKVIVIMVTTTIQVH